MSFSGRCGALAKCDGTECISTQEYSKFLHTLQADLVRPFLDRQYPATLAVMAADNKLERKGANSFGVNPRSVNPQSAAHWRRSQHPLASSHSSEESTLARARAIEQSAAPQ
jgi:hypothetical protein